VSLLAVLALLGGAAYFFRNEIGSAIARVQDELGKSAKPDVRPVDHTASPSVADDRGPERTYDRNSQTSWATDGSDDTEDFVELIFDEPFRLVTIGVTSGAAAEEGRPIKLKLTPIDSRNEPGEPRDLILKDLHELQAFYVGADDVKKLRVEIVDVRPDKSPLVAITELEFWARAGTAPEPAPSGVP
jgi:hypothetical protein